MREIKFEESTIPVMFQTELASHDLLWTADNTKKIMDTIFLATASFLGSVKSRDYDVALRFDDVKGNLLLAALVGYEPSEDESAPGNIFMEFTMDEADITSTEDHKIRVYNANDTEFSVRESSIAYKEHSMIFNNKDYTSLLTRIGIELILKWLDENTIEGEETKLTCSPLFEAKASLDESGAKVFALVPSGELKRKVKEDSAIEK